MDTTPTALIAEDESLLAENLRQELARLVGCSREMAGRVLKKLQEDGKLHARGKTVVVYGTR